MRFWNSPDDFTMDAADNRYNVYDDRDYAHSGSRVFGSRLRNERLSPPFSTWEPRSSPQGGIHDNEHTNWVSDVEAYVNQNQEVRNNERMQRRDVYSGEYSLSFAPANLPVRGLWYAERREEDFPSPQDHHRFEYHHSWSPSFPVVSEKHPSAALSPALDDYFSRQFCQHLPNRSKASDLTDSSYDDIADVNSPTLVQVTTADESSIHHDPLHFDATSSTPKSPESQDGNFFRRQWRNLNVTAASLHRQRRRIRHNLRVLHRAQRALELKRGKFQNMLKNNMQNPDRFQRWHSTGERIGMYDGDNDWRRDTRHSWRPRGKRTGHSGEEDPLYGAWRSNDEPRETSSRDYHHSTKHSYDDDPHGQTVRPLPTADVVSRAKKEIANYDSAWMSLSERAQTSQPRIPYPTVTTHCGPLLEPFPSYIRLPRPPAFHPPAHVRIQYHALEFYLHPFGLQVSLTFDPPLQSSDDPQQIPNAPVIGVDGIESLSSSSFLELKGWMMDDTKRWHEDSLRKKGFGPLLDSGSPISRNYDRNPEQRQYSGRPERVACEFPDIGERLTERDIVQGVWAAVQSLKDFVLTEMKRRHAE
ncbi:hypothetical protein MMC34_005729 [Xylographa carneopallida]|nr:hypothetical protein [Xylographa carneopallida]